MCVGRKDTHEKVRQMGVALSRNTRNLLQIFAVGALLGLPFGLVVPQAIGQQADGRGGETKTQAKAASKADAAKRARDAKKTGDPKAPKLDAAAAQQEVENGINALTAGRFDQAVANLTTGLGAGSLPSAQTARALYYRGLAYRRQSKPAPAIADFHSALWIKGGLSEQQRADALAQRSAAYRDAGLPDQSEPVSAKAADAVAASSKQAPGTTEKTAQGSITTVSPGSNTLFGNLFGGGFGGSSQPAPKPAAPAAPVPAASPAAPGPAIQTASVPAASKAVNAARAQPSPVPTQAAVAPASATKMVAERLPPAPQPLPMGFQDFGAPPAAPVRVPASQVAAQTPAAPAGGASRAWGSSTEVRAAPSRAGGPASSVSAPPAKPAAKPNVKAKAVEPAGASTGVRIQVAAVRSAQEAQGVVQRVQERLGRELGGRVPVVDQAAMGSIGTLYRVQIGPFASASDSQGLCAKLKSEGLDCRIVSQ